MDRKENKGGILTNEDVEQDNPVKGKTEGGYRGVQDTGDNGVRQKGNDVQQRDGLADDEKSEEA